MNFLLDPFILAVPLSSDTPEESENYIECLVEWSGEIKKQKHKFWLSYPIVEALQTCGQYPFLDNLKKINLPYDNNESISQAITVFRACEPELVAPPYIDDVFSIREDVCCDDSTTIILPPEIETRLSPDVANALKATLGNLAIASRFDGSQLAEEITFATRFEDHQHSPSITLNGKSLDICCNKVEDLHAEWQVIQHPNELDVLEDETTYIQNHWRETIGTLNWLYSKWCADGTINPAEFPLPVIRLGRQFIGSIVDNHYENHRTILTDIFTKSVQALCGITARKNSLGTNHHPLFDGDETDSPQRERKTDGATAWRVYIRQYRPAVRLHYWLLPNDSVELSKVGPHDDMTIR